MALKEGDFVLIHYTIKTIDGGEEVIDTTREEVAKEAGVYDPNRRYGEHPVVVGRSRLIDAVDEALKEMEPGERREVVAPPEKAYGMRDEKLVIRIPVKQLRRHNITPRVGQEIEVGGRVGRIIRVTERFAYIDFNHPLAGKKLKIELEVVKKVETNEEKLEHLSLRWLGVKPLSTSASNGVMEVVLPSEVLGMHDLDSRLRLLAQDVYDLLSPEKLRIIVEVEYPKEAEEESGEAAEASSSKEGEAGESS
ncbi:MAG: peptidylprolyl isomerase [Desulfurococcales archaeon]|nr:peptidylprolyl isomerase [Desulfurococcales archaeon]MCE4605412.1 peptidylprolyl isomerase [Desulfurococcales archaeon]